MLTYLIVKELYNYSQHITALALRQALNDTETKEVSLYLYCAGICLRITVLDKIGKSTSERA